ncbi:hypothetical protein RFI02_19830 [Acinetobacter sichuanensis]|uniref:hypothetical protein n=1 Tax=Acinetobacter sichuanensis TaxID=2136183 RepID=UPI00280C7180|nr:hypothetical protein [Acinetobacter sichuanensis]MDQ9023345.1 hypothetical protein [Acinetobacter sichuanensis]
MTVINSHESLIKKVGGIEKAKAIVEGAPEWASIYDPDVSDYFKGDLKGDRDYWLDDLRDAIEYHYYGRSEAEELAAYAELSQEKIEGVTTFDEWWKVNELKYDYVFPASRDAFKAGQKSRQAEIDRLEEWNSNQARSIKTYQGEDEDLKVLLQKLIDDEYTTMRPSMAYEIQKALRGERE